MSTLTRRPTDDDHREGWHVYFGDVQIGWIGRRAGVPHDLDQWGWQCGFYPGMHPGRALSGSGETFEAARTGFEDAWQSLLPELTEADFQKWRHHRDWTERKYAMWARGEKLPSQIPSSMMTCACGARFDSHMPADSQLHCPHIYASQVHRA